MSGPSSASASTVKARPHARGWTTPERSGGTTKRWRRRPASAPSACVGAVYRIHRTAEGAALIGGPQAPRYLRMSDDPRLPAWRAEHEHTKTRIEAARARKRAAAEHRGDLGRLTLAEAAAWYRGHA